MGDKSGNGSLLHQLVHGGSRYEFLIGGKHDAAWISQNVR